MADKKRMKRTAFTLSADALHGLRVLASIERQTLSQLVDKIVSGHIADYSKKNPAVAEALKQPAGRA